MTQVHKPPKSPFKLIDSIETLRFENAELRNTAAELMLQMTILREALTAATAQNCDSSRRALN